VPLKIKCMRNFAAAYLTKVRATEVRIHSDARKYFDAVAPTHTEKLVDLSIYGAFLPCQIWGALNCLPFYACAHPSM